MIELEDIDEMASRICTSCGMCCNGVLFQVVRLQPEDSVKELEALGMKLGRKKREPYFKQPCQFLHECRCEIYAGRPTRCRDFECRQIQLLAARQVSEDEVMQLVEDVKGRVAKIEEMLGEAGNFEFDASLSERCAQVTESGGGADIDKLRNAMTALSAVLGRNFRVKPVS